MRLVYASLPYKAIAVLRFYFARLFYLGRFKCPTMSMIGKGCSLFISKQGKVDCAGRVILADHVVMQTQGKGIISIGDKMYLNHFSRIVAHEKVEIGKNAFIGQMVTIVDHDHDYVFEGEDMKISGFNTAPIKIGNNVWIADKVTVLKGVTIGNNVVVAANSVINKDVPDNSIVGGIPAKVLKTLK